MKKVIVIGSPGAGKSYFSQELRDVTGLSLYHLDMIYHREDSSHITKEEFEDRLREIFKRDSWIIDGNYQRTLEMRLNECDTVFLLDFPVELCLLGANKRVGTKRDDLPWVEDSLDPDFEKRIMDFPKEKLPKIYELLEKYKDRVDIIIFKSREEADNYIKNYNSMI